MQTTAVEAVDVAKCVVSIVRVVLYAAPATVADVRTANYEKREEYAYAQENRHVVETQIGIEEAFE